MSQPEHAGCHTPTRLLDSFRTRDLRGIALALLEHRLRHLADCPVLMFYGTCCEKYRSFMSLCKLKDQPRTDAPTAGRNNACSLIERPPCLNLDMYAARPKTWHDLQSPDHHAVMIICLGESSTPSSCHLPLLWSLPAIPPFMNSSSISYSALGPPEPIELSRLRGTPRSVSSTRLEAP